MLQDRLRRHRWQYGQGLSYWAGQETSDLVRQRRFDFGRGKKIPDHHPHVAVFRWVSRGHHLEIRINAQGWQSKVRRRQVLDSVGLSVIGDYLCRDKIIDHQLIKAHLG